MLRRIPAGTFMMGSPEDEIGRNEAREKLHLTTISRSFYMGVFEMTQKQYENITGTAVTDDSFKGDKRPANKVSYDDLRGVGAAVYGAETADWPNYHEGGFFDSFNKKVTLPEKLSGYVFDLPSAAQWEYACRAGTLGAWNDGTTITNESTDDNLGRIGYYRGNAGFRLHDVGEKDVANAFGLYDMHGNVLEFVIDYVNGGTGAVFFDGSPVVDPILYSPTKWPQTVGKGGNYGRNPFECRSAIFVNAGAVSDQSQAQGFRLALYHR